MPITVYKEDKPTDIDDTEKLKETYQVIEAAGGAVVNDDGEILLIFRKGKWDLPKGKREGNEPLALCADREVKEETGLTELALRSPLIVTYHIYSEKGKAVLKETHWFLFDAPGRQEVQPQTEEEIYKVEWVSRENLSEFTGNTYQLIRDVLAAAGF
jgi:ADP-ribose pyrophosphatase YjhB (NUDIX family)